jgi:anti-sigma regulatory factor (Ser/Thr protein kinase)
MELRVKANDESLQTVNDFIHSSLPSACDEMILNQIDLAVEEIFVNIAHYSGADEAIINCSFENDKLEITFSDSGVPFNPLAKPDPDITLNAEEREIGGLGIYLTKKFMDTVSYEYKDGMNCLRIIKSVQS